MQDEFSYKKRHVDNCAFLMIQDVGSRTVNVENLGLRGPLNFQGVFRARGNPECRLGGSTHTPAAVRACTLPLSRTSVDAWYADDK